MGFYLRQFDSRDHTLQLRSYYMEYSILDFRLLDTLRSSMERKGRKSKRKINWKRIMNATNGQKWGFCESDTSGNVSKGYKEVRRLGSVIGQWEIGVLDV